MCLHDRIANIMIYIRKPTIVDELFDYTLQIVSRAPLGTINDLASRKMIVQLPSLLFPCGQRPSVPR